MAQEAKNDTYGGWEFIEVSYHFKKPPLYASIYFEHDNLEYKRLECWYTRTTFGVKILPWLKADIAYDFLYEPGGQLTHKALFNLSGTLTQGNLKVSLRERYVHDWLVDEGKQDNVLRSQLKAQYAIPKSHFSPYLAIEMFTWDTWKKPAITWVALSISTGPSSWRAIKCIILSKMLPPSMSSALA